MRRSTATVRAGNGQEGGGEEELPRYEPRKPEEAAVREPPGYSEIVLHHHQQDRPRSDGSS